MLKQKTVYFREEDLPLWENVQNKAEFMHRALTDGLQEPSHVQTIKLGKNEREYVRTPQKQPKVERFSELKDLSTSSDMTKRVDDFKPVDAFVPKPPDPETGYPCCAKARPCKHWQWDSGKSVYINSLTGKQREPDLN